MINISNIHKVAVLRGGPSIDYERSLKTGKVVKESLLGHYEVVDITIDQQGKWYKNGIEVSPVKALIGVDVVFNAMHGEFGEDGNVQRILESLNIINIDNCLIKESQNIKVKSERDIKEDIIVEEYTKKSLYKLSQNKETKWYHITYDSDPESDYYSDYDSN